MRSLVISILYMLVYRALDRCMKEKNQCLWDEMLSIAIEHYIQGPNNIYITNEEVRRKVP